MSDASAVVPTGWKVAPLSSLAQVVSGGTPSRDASSYWGGEIPWVTPTDITQTSGRYLLGTREHITRLGLGCSAATLLPSGTILMTSRATVGESRIAGIEVCTNQGFKSLVPLKGVSGLFLYYQMQRLRNAYKVFGIGSTFLEVSKKDTERFNVLVPKDEDEQRAIAGVLDSIDHTIEQTESLIAKYQKIKTGLMHDLFTRGVTADGKLRPPREQAPELYQETPIGWIPKEWDISNIGAMAESLVDGPFGSNLKTEHYVADPGVRVVRLQNIQATTYNDDDRAYITEKHASFLVRNKVVSGDILIAGLGEERYPVGRACLYPQHLPPAINKADCFRLRCNVNLAVNPFVMSYLNTSTARRQVVKYEQGVTRPRINLGNLKKVLLPRPNLNEQEQIWERLEKAANQIGSLESAKLKLVKQKAGLMHDLLTGKVRVIV